MILTWSYRNEICFRLCLHSILMYPETVPYHGVIIWLEYIKVSLHECSWSSISLQWGQGVIDKCNAKAEIEVTDRLYLQVYKRCRQEKLVLEAQWMFWNELVLIVPFCSVFQSSSFPRLFRLSLYHLWRINIPFSCRTSGMTSTCKLEDVKGWKPCKWRTV